MTTKSDTTTLVELPSDHWAHDLDRDEKFIAAQTGLSQAQNMDLMMLALSVLD